MGPLRLRGAVVGPLKKCRGCPPSSGGVSFRVVKSHFWWFGPKKRSIYFVAPAGFFGNNNLVDLVPAMPDGKEFEAG